MSVALINPPLIEDVRNIGSSVTIPLGLLYLAAYLREKNLKTYIIDGFGEKPFQTKILDKKRISLGLSLSEIVANIKSDTRIIGISVMTAVSHNISLEIIKAIKQNYPNMLIVIGGNHATFRYKDFLNNGADYVVLGEGEKTFFSLINAIINKLELSVIDGLAYKDENNIIKVLEKKTFIEDLNQIPYPARDLLPLENYWKFKQGQGAVGKRFLTIISSRGCPYSCTFCSSPLFWKKKWRYRSPLDVVDEIEFCIKHFTVREFHFEDDSMTTSKERLIAICKEIIKRNLKISWSLPNGLRSDTLDEEALEWMQLSGCKYFLVAPESGSNEILKLMKKPINLKHMKLVVRVASKLKINTGAFFIIGYPSESFIDRLKTVKFLLELMLYGLDEFGMCTLTPLPGNTIGGKYSLSDDFTLWDDFWVSLGGNNSDRKQLFYFKLFSYFIFHSMQFFIKPSKVLKRILGVVFTKQRTKTDMIIARKLTFLRLLYKNYKGAYGKTLKTFSG